MRSLLPLVLAAAGCTAVPAAAPAPSTPVAASGLRHVVVTVDKLE